MILWSVVVAGGGGTRYGGLKQFSLLGGRRVLDWSIAALAPVSAGVVVVVPADQLDQVFAAPGADGRSAPELPSADRPLVTAVAGGPTRSDSVRAGLAAIDPSATHVLVHDAARPLASAPLIGRVCAALAGGAQAVVPVVPVTDSLRTVEGEPVDRSRLVAVQTPQGFTVESLRRAHGQGDTATDDASLFHALGIPVVHVAGDPTNMKITESFDLRVAEVLLHDR